MILPIVLSLMKTYKVRQNKQRISFNQARVLLIYLKSPGYESYSTVLDFYFSSVYLVEGCIHSSVCLKQAPGLFLVIKVVTKKTVSLYKMLSSTWCSFALICSCFFLGLCPVHEKARQVLAIKYMVLCNCESKKKVFNTENELSTCIIELRF